MVVYVTKVTKDMSGLDVIESTSYDEQCNGNG